MCKQTGLRDCLDSPGQRGADARHVAVCCALNPAATAQRAIPGAANNFSRAYEAPPEEPARRMQQSAPFVPHICAAATEDLGEVVRLRRVIADLEEAVRVGASGSDGSVAALSSYEAELREVYPEYFAVHALWGSCASTASATPSGSTPSPIPGE